MKSIQTSFFWAIPNMNNNDKVLLLFSYKKIYAQLKQYCKAFTTFISLKFVILNLAKSLSQHAS